MFVNHAVMPDFSTATGVLEAIVQEEYHQDLFDWLVAHDVTDSEFCNETWTALWRVMENEHTTWDELAYAARLAVVDQFPVLDSVEVDDDLVETIPSLVVGFAQRTSFATFGDEYVAAALKVKMPRIHTVCHPRKHPAYAIAAKVFGEETNTVVRPLIQQPLKELLRAVRWHETNVNSLFAVVIALKEMVRFPELYIDSDIAAANQDIPAVVVWGDPMNMGVLSKGQLIKCTSVVNTIAVCLSEAETDIPEATTLLDVLKGRDIISALYHAFTAGKEILGIH
ncbi:MAG: hypothetical protein CL678_11770 [Bdellovibrionaceae bacterium]|nr:hypothetical protein [Pseudobdellovibrionaceae bacterium]